MYTNISAEELNEVITKGLTNQNAVPQNLMQHLQKPSSTTDYFEHNNTNIPKD
jgi:hypothetical protein